MRRRTARLYALTAIATTLAFADPGQAGTDVETQWWGLRGASLPSPPRAPFDSEHIHLRVLNYPLGETITTSDGQYVFNTVGLRHNAQGTRARFIRGGNFQQGGTIPHCGIDRLVTTQDETFSCTLRRAATVPNGKHENRFSFFADDRAGAQAYQSSAFWTFVGQPGAPVPVTGRGWSQAGEYVNFTLKDSNLGSGSGYRASWLEGVCAPDAWTHTYSLAQGATHAFTYVDPDLHHERKGTVLFENQIGSSGTFTIDTTTLSPGYHVLLGGAWEKTSVAISAGTLRLRFLVC